MTTALLVLGCLLTGGGTALFFLAAGDGPDGAEGAGGGRSARSPASTAALARPPVRGAGAGAGRAHDFMLWERELLSGDRHGREHDQRARRDLERWGREARRRRRGE